MSVIQYYNYLTKICPNCNESIKYAPNPYYIFVCEKCGHSGNSSELKEGIFVELAKKMIQEKEDEINRIKIELKEKINIICQEDIDKRSTKFNKFEIMDI